MNKCDQNFTNRDKPDWDDHDYPAICLGGNSNWYGLHEPIKPYYSEQWKGKEVTLLREQGDFLKYGEKTSPDIEDMFEVRPA